VYDSVVGAITVNETNLPTSSCVNGSCAYVLAPMSPQEGAYWRVRARGSEGWGDWSIQGEFTIESLAVPVILSPLSGGISNAEEGLQLSFAPVAQAISYQTQLYDTELERWSQLSDVNSVACSDDVCTLNAGIFPQQLGASWRVRASNEYGVSDWSSPAVFDMVSTPDIQSIPYLTLFCSFADSTNEFSNAMQSHSDLFFRFGGLNDYWKEVSGNRFDLAGSEFAGPYDLPFEANYYNALDKDATHSALSQDCKDAASSYIDVSAYSYFNYVTDNSYDHAGYGFYRNEIVGGELHTLFGLTK